MRNLGQYVVERKLERGSFGTVELAHHELFNMKVAIKVIENVIIQVRKSKEQLLNEMSILRSFRHPNIIRLIETMRSTSKFYIVMEYAEGGDLFNYLREHGRFSEKNTRFFFRQILQAVEFCHSRGLTHRDIKLENVVLCTNNVVKLIDFGFSKEFNYSELMQSNIGSLKYLDPARLKKQDYSGESADLWSLGVVLYALLVGSRPFDGDYSSAILLQALNRNYSVPSDLSAEAKDLIARMLEPSSAKRISLQEVKMHPWYVFEDLCPLIDTHFFREQSSKDRFNPYSIASEPFERLKALPYNWEGIGTDEGVRAAIEAEKNEPFVNTYKMLYYEWSDKMALAEPYSNHSFVFKRLGELASEPERVKKLTGLLGALFVEQGQSVVAKPWKTAFRIPFELRVIVMKLSRLFDQLKIKIEILNKTEPRFSCNEIADKKKTGRSFQVQFYDDGGASVMLIKNESFEILSFVHICSKIQYLLRADQF